MGVELRVRKDMIESAHTTVHIRLGSRTGQAPIQFRSAFGNRETILILVGEFTHRREPYSSLRTSDYLR